MEYDSQVTKTLGLISVAIVALWIFRSKRPSTNFSIAELTVTSTGLANDPNAEQRANLSRLASEILEPLRAQFGPLTPTSAFRSIAVNQAVGGVSDSSHLSGAAVDLYAVNGASGEAMAAWLYENRALPINQVVVYPDSTGHLHIAIELTGEPYRRSFLEKTSEKQPNGKYYKSWIPRGNIS